MSRSLTMLDGCEDLIREVVAASVAAAEPGGMLYAKPLLDEIDALRAKLAEERRRVARLALALEEVRCTCEAVSIGGMPTSLKCVRCRALERHNAPQTSKDAL